MPLPLLIYKQLESIFMDFFQPGLYPNCFDFFFEPSILYLLYLMKSLDPPVLSSEPMVVFPKPHWVLLHLRREEKHAGAEWACSSASRLFPGISLPPALHFHCLQLLIQGGSQLSWRQICFMAVALNEEHFCVHCVLSWPRLMLFCLDFWGKKRLSDCPIAKGHFSAEFYSPRLKVKHVTTKLVYVISRSESAVTPKIRYLIGLWEKQMPRDAIPTI